ncbi:3'-5' exonuclease [Rhodoferax saidenbachensis]|uniref:DNA polymerase-3 subunit epsilon n=1 Tax=Rhodoferax saidenbachensis TaxID=1484693 RepID=A0ABU1ZHS9_9BURK|nr:3'-5' exonuclease [Rhodoferax saidenbachensis]MDR7305092.1 DNA polymerase-3 subunit epsilon [Rhodoferax saidenbachensis]
MTTDQLGFDFLPDLPTLPSAKPAAKKRTSSAATKAPASARAAPAPVAEVAPAAPALDAEAMARALEAHPDYRVQRRLVPKLNWPGTAQGAIKRILVLDTETTGLDQAREKIIELALLRVDVDTATGLPVGPVQVYDGLEDPGKPIPAEVVKITGITDADVQGQALDLDRVAELLDGVDVVIAHNAGFDRPFVESRLPAFAKVAWSCSFADIDWKAQGRGSAKLESLAQELGLFYDAHRAEMDCHALLAVLAVPLPHAPHTGLAQLLEAANHPSYRLSATNAPFDAKDLLKARGYRWNADQRVWATRLADDAALHAEFDWLRDQVYNHRHAAVQIEKMDALAKYSNRGGVVAHQQL